MSQNKHFTLWCKVLVAAIGLLFQSMAPAANFDHTGKMDFDNLLEGQELGCLAMNIYHEGRGESAKGRAAIAAVTMNRVASPFFADTVCEVVWQRKQFSWTKIAERHHVIRDSHSWVQALIIARLFIDGARVFEVGDATHYHAGHVDPYWSETKTLLGKVGNHYFYTL